MVPCGDDVRLYSSPLIKFSKACTQVVSGRAWYLSGELMAMPLLRYGCGTHACAAVVGANMRLSCNHCLPPTRSSSPIPPLAVRVGYPCFGTPRRVNGKIVGYPAWGRYRVHNL